MPGTPVSLSPRHTLQSSRSSQHTDWKHLSLLPTRRYQGLSLSRPGSDKGGFSHVLCAAVNFLGSMDQGGGTGRGSLSSGSVDPPFLNPRRFFNKQPTEKPRLGVEHYPCRSPRPLAEGGKDTCLFFFSLADKQSSRDINKEQGDKFHSTEWGTAPHQTPHADG